ncbi:hypothetical protein PAPYR_1156 [Paratrimastix pyriformis]|uniref:Coiled-coil domain-containing protein 86 n=1 Tax=Paratrimastix pyriformis TaxID=342808 RepID=A0ABQ8US98_9EUKA|nr:hypothetical protein PAPYR_1156 [Paratrimastix pyriformis]
MLRAPTTKAGKLSKIITCKQLKPSYEQQKEQKAKLRAIREKELEMKKAQDEKKKRQRIELQRRQKEKAEKDKNAMVLQTINPKKIKHMNRKTLRHLTARGDITTK